MAELLFVSESSTPLPPPFDGYPSRAISPWLTPSPQEAARRRRLLWRLRLLLAGSLATFTLVTWIFARSDGAIGFLSIDPGPSVTVRRHFEALNRGELRAAYGLFSEHYREDVPFQMYHDLVSSHWQMFRTRRVDYDRREFSPQRAVMEARMVSADGQRYVARFTLVQSDGHWWIDDVRWRAAREDQQRIRV